jgi:hypothetical protein
MKTVDELNGMMVSELRTLIREEYKAGTLFAGIDSKTVSTFVNFGTKETLVAAIHAGAIPNATPVVSEQGATMTADVPQEQEAPAASGAPMNAMAFVQQAIDDAFKKGKAEGLKLGAAKANEVAEAVKNEYEVKLQEKVIELENFKLTNGGNGAAMVAGDAGAEGAAPVEGGTPDLNYALKVVKNTQGGGGILIPNLDKFFIIQKSVMEMLDDMADMATKECKPKGVLLVGHKGCGKSTIPEQWSAKNGRPYFKVNAALLREAKEWFGSKSVLNGSLYFIMSEFCRALETPNCTVMVDEINRAITHALQALLGVLDSGKTYVEELGRHVVCAKGVVVCASMNEGAEYTVNELDAALKDRFPIRIECTYLPEDDEVLVLKNKGAIDEPTARRLVLMASTIRSKCADASGMGGTLHESISTRQLIEAGKMFKKRGKASLEFTIINRYSRVGGRESEQAQVANIVQGVFG